MPQETGFGFCTARGHLVALDWGGAQRPVDLVRASRGPAWFRVSLLCAGRGGSSEPFVCMFLRWCLPPLPWGGACKNVLLTDTGWMVSSCL